MTPIVIGSRFCGPSLIHTPDGRYEAVYPPMTVAEERLQDALLADKLPETLYPRRWWR